MNVLLSGGTRGLGLAIATRLLRQNHHVWILARKRSVALGGLMNDHPGLVTFIECDLSRVDDLRETLRSTIDSNSVAFDALINNAAIAYDDLVSNLAIESLEEMFRVNVYAPMELARFAIRNFLLHQTEGSIVHISSICSRTGYKGLAMYGATKGALESFSRGVAREWGSRKIRSNCVLPGFMETEMSSRLTSEQLAKIYRRTSLGAPTDPDSVAATVEFLIGSESSSITGQEFVVDSGSL